jgi:hypothetical protein
MALNDLVVYYVLPFILIFVLVFAILQKSKLFGDGKNQIDALLAFVIAGLFVAVPGPHVEMTISMLPVLAIALVTILIFFLIYGFFNGDMSTVDSWMKYGSLVIAILFVVGVLYYLTPARGLLDSFLVESGEIFFSIIILIVVAIAIFFAVRTSGD